MVQILLGFGSAGIFWAGRALWALVGAQLPSHHSTPYALLPLGCQRPMAPCKRWLWKQAVFQLCFRSWHLCEALSALQMCESIQHGLTKTKLCLCRRLRCLTCFGETFATKEGRDLPATLPVYTVAGLSRRRYGAYTRVKEEVQLERIFISAQPD